MSAVPAPRPARKPARAYHHGNLRQALVDQAARTIRDTGVEALTLRDVGERLRVSRTALYRHFADKQALLAAVAAQGFRAFRQALAEAWEPSRHDPAGFIDMGRAYVRFARDNASFYRVMFGGFVDKVQCDPALADEAGSAFSVLVSAIAELQAKGAVRDGDPQGLAVYVWASSHGLALLAIDGQLSRPGVDLDALIEATIAQMWQGIAREPRYTTRDQVAAS